MDLMDDMDFVDRAGARQGSFACQDWENLDESATGNLADDSSSRTTKLKSPLG
jgi:hypothetical protein